MSEEGSYSDALEDAAGLAVGVVLDPVRDECFIAERGAAPPELLAELATLVG